MESQKIENHIKPRVLIHRTHRVKAILRRYRLNTVCEEAFCPNISECFDRGIATFLLMGRICTRYCSFCGIKKMRNPPQPAPHEPENLKRAVQELGMRYVVLTSVNRDDLEDMGANHLAKCIKEVKSTGAKVEILSPDLGYRLDLIDILLEAQPDVFAHNVETVYSLYPKVRPYGDFEGALKILRYAKEKGSITKTSFIVGLGETKEELYECIKMVRNTGCDIITIGQYFQPSLKKNQNVKNFFCDWEELENYCINLGFKGVFVGPRVRSSYLADKIFPCG